MCFSNLSSAYFNSFIIISSYLLTKSDMKEDQPALQNSFSDPALTEANKHFMARQFEAAIPLYQQYIQDRFDSKT